MNSPFFQLKLGQQLKMTPQMQQAIRLLQLSGQALELEIQSILESNPALEYEPQTLESESQEDHLDDYNSVGLDPNSSRHDHNSIEPQYFSKESSADTSLQQHLQWQLEVAPFSKRERLIANAIIDVISEDGYCTCSLEEICDTLKSQESLHVEKVEIEKILVKIQQFEPLGVGARNLSECLMLQVNALPESTPHLMGLKKLVCSHLDILAKRDFPALKRLLNITEVQLKNIIQLITHLDPKPGKQISSLKKTDYIIPDLIVRKKNNVFVVELNKRALPKVRINSEYLHYMKLNRLNRNTQNKNPKEKENQKEKLIQKQFKEAEWFLKNLNHRFATLLKVGSSIIEEQYPFLEKGEEFMKGLLLQDIATKTELHESTISRITTQKYIYTPRGIFELKYFFSKPLINTLGELHSTTAIRATLKKFIQNESASNPHSDEKLKQLLKEQGMDISRRTISKYRETMKIPSSHERRRYQQPQEE